ncbi:MAG: Trm112 family protein [Bacteroidetes bacterium]|nr:MAG: Trm112 family protein [Bacteroidota bacterium]
MKKEHIKLLICPYCHGELELTITKEKNDEIIEGSLKCKNCGKEYEIKEGIPKML